LQQEVLKQPRFSVKYAFEKPNDRRGLDLMNAAAKAVMTELPDIIIAYANWYQQSCQLLQPPMFGCGLHIFPTLHYHHLCQVLMAELSSIPVSKIYGII
ncbi:hypothetical protein DH86_00002219, partial [Scytalidium sp. 3C]